MRTVTKLWLFIIALMVLTPIGLALPEYFKAGSAWGEWGPDEIAEMVGYIPAGLARLASLWNAPVPDYVFKGWENKGLTELSFAYITSAVIGVTITAGVIFCIGKILIGKDE